MKRNKNIKKYVPSLLTGLLLCGACASIGTPSGGPRDEEPPRFVRANPAPGSVNVPVNPQRISLEFDELVNVKDSYSKVVVSPPSRSMPRVSSLGRRVNIQFTDSLLPNTTYTIDFGNSIEDNNEGNKLPGFTYVFSTGPEIDTLQISGMVLSADNLEPQQAMLVGVHSNLSDTAFAKLPFERMAKTDDRGRFTIYGLAPGSYRIYALGDNDNDYMRANPEEAMAFYDVTISPSTERTTTTDTIFNLKTGSIDTIVSRERTRYLPNDILLRSFESDYKPQYLSKYERQDSTRLSFIFNSKSDSLPQISIVGKETSEDWFLLERSAHNDTLTYWILPQEIISTDSLRIAARYLRTDSAQNLTAFNDTLRFFMPRARNVKKNDKKKDENLEDSVAAKPLPLGLKMTSSMNQEVFLPIFFEFDTPLSRLDTSAFHLEMMEDTLWVPVKQTWKPVYSDSLTLRKMKIEYPWAYDTQYKLTIDSMAATGIYGLVNDPLEHTFTTKKEEDYCSLIFNISNFTDTVGAFMELLNTSDVPVRREPVVNGKAVFKYLQPGKYYARIYEDMNGNGIFDTGNFEENRQPDVAYYYPKIINLKKNWDSSQDWAVFDTAVDMMKPEQIKKNKPEADKRARNRNNGANNEEEEEEDYYDPTYNPFDN